MEGDNPHKPLGNTMLVIGWLLALGLLTLYFNHWQTKRVNPNAMPHSVTAAGAREVVLQRNHQHHYVATGMINGHRVTFLVDTGATHVSVPKKLANRLQLQEGAPQLYNTANGVVETRATVIDELVLGAITLRDVRASINPGMHQDEILLGMSALKNVEFTHRDGQLTLKQYY